MAGFTTTFLEEFMSVDSVPVTYPTAILLLNSAARVV